MSYRPLALASPAQLMWSAALVVAALIALPATPDRSLRAQSADPADTSLFIYVLDIPTRYINDHCLIRRGNRWHLFYTDGAVGRNWGRRGNEVGIGHAVSFDLLHWSVLAPVLTTGPEEAPDHAHVYSPYVIERNGTYYMYYAGNKRSFVAGEYILAATSTDLFTWTRLPGGPVVPPDPRWAYYYPEITAEVREGPASQRDPHIIYDSAYGYILYYAGELKGNPEKGWNERHMACIAAATSPDLKTWTDRGPVLIREAKGTEENTFAQPESPCVIKRDGQFYLFWKGGNGMRYAVSKNPLDFDNGSEKFLATSHASEIIEWKNRWFITSCSRALNDITHRASDRSRGLYLAELVWDGNSPQARRLTAPTVDSTDTLMTPPPAAYSTPLGMMLWVNLPTPVSAQTQMVITDTLGVERLRVRPEIDMVVETRIGIPTTSLPPGVYLLRSESIHEKIRFAVY